MSIHSAGPFDQLISIDRRPTVGDVLGAPLDLAPSGQTVQRWVPHLVDIVARVVPVRGREVLQAAALGTTATAKFVIRHRPGLDATMSIRWRGARYGIEHIANLGGLENDLEITATDMPKEGPA